MVSRSEERALIARYHRDGDQQAREQLIVKFMPLARQLAIRYHRGAEPLEDLVQVANMGLVKAVDRFDHTRTTAFSSYAVPTILGELRRHFRDKTWTVRVPRDLQELVLRIDKANDRFSADHDRSPTVTEMAAMLDVTEEDVLEAMQASRARHSTSMDAPAAGADEDAHTLGDTIGSTEGGYADAERRAVLAPLLDSLDGQEQEILRLRFEEDLTQAQIAEQMGCSQMQISRLLRRALADMQARAGVS